MSNGPAPWVSDPVRSRAAILPGVLQLLQGVHGEKGSGKAEYEDEDDFESICADILLVAQLSTFRASTPEAWSIMAVLTEGHLLLILMVRRRSFVV